MKKFLLVVFLCIAGAHASHAVVIHWAATTSTGFNSANLVWISGSTPSGDEIVAAYSAYVDSATGAGIVSGQGVYERVASDATTRNSGYYCVILFQNSQAVAYGTPSLAYNNPSAIGNDPMNPPTGVFSPGEWTPIPEPCTMALMGFGMATMAIRRRCKKRRA